jgi:hypothetical protein
MIACGQTPSGSTSATSTLGPVGRFMQKLLAPLANGAGDVDLITGPETSPNVTQSETYTLANPDNPLQIVTAYNDSRGRNLTPINISGASVLYRWRQHVRPAHAGQRSGAFLQHGRRSSRSVSQAKWHLVYRLARCGVRRPGPRWVQVDHSRACHQLDALPVRSLQLAGTTVSLVGLIITLPVHSMDECMFRGTTSMLIAAPFLSPTPLMRALRGTLRYR